MIGHNRRFPRLLLRCLIASAAFSLALAGLVFTGLWSKAVSVLLYPAFRLADFLFGSRVATNENGFNNLIELLPFVFVLNVLVYAILFCLLAKVVELVRATSTRKHAV